MVIGVRDGRPPGIITARFWELRPESAPLWARSASDLRRPFGRDGGSDGAGTCSDDASGNDDGSGDGDSGGDRCAWSRWRYRWLRRPPNSRPIELRPPGARARRSAFRRSRTPGLPMPSRAPQRQESEAPSTFHSDSSAWVIGSSASGQFPPLVSGRSGPRGQRTPNGRARLDCHNREALDKARRRKIAAAISLIRRPRGAPSDS